jgi:hypothetical protein
MNRLKNKISVLAICILCCVSCWAGSILAMPIFGWILWSSVFYPAVVIARWMQPIGTPASLAFAIGFIQACLMALMIWAGYLAVYHNGKK